MIIIIDIFIIMLITILSIYNSFNRKLIEELLKLGSFILALILTNVTSLNTKLNYILTTKVQSALNADKSFNVEVFYAISSLLVFAVFYIIILSFFRLSKSYLKDLPKSKSDFFHKIAIVCFSTIRMVLIFSLLVYSLESSIFHANSIKEKIHSSPSLKAFSSFSNTIISK